MIDTFLLVICFCLIISQFIIIYYLFHIDCHVFNLSRDIHLNVSRVITRLYGEKAT